MAPTDNELLTQMGTALIRLDSKMDNVLTGLSRLENNHHDHELRIRIIEAVYATRQQLKEMEDTLNRRIKEIADKPTVSPGTMWKVAGFAMTVLSFVWGLVAFLMR